MFDPETRWSDDVVDAILKRHFERYKSLPSAARLKLRKDMVDLIERQVREALEAELTLAGKLHYRGIDRAKRMQFLLSKIPNAKAILGTVALHFIAEFVKPSLSTELLNANASVRLFV